MRAGRGSGRHLPVRGMGQSDPVRRTPFDLPSLEICFDTPSQLVLQRFQRVGLEAWTGRSKAALGPRLRTRSLPGQQGEVVLAAEVLNRNVPTAKPVSARVA